MKRLGLALLIVVIAAGNGAAEERVEIDLTRWTSPDIATLGDDALGALVRYGDALFTDTANEIGPTVPDG